MLYKVVVVLHVVAVLGYLLAHGVSVAVAFALKRERNMDKIKTLLELSGNSYPIMFGSFYASILFGIAAGFQGGWWRFGWIWASIGLLIVIFGLMIRFGGNIYSAARRAAGMLYRIHGKPFPAEPAKSNEVVYAILAQSNPVMLTIVGYGGYALIAWLMTVKPF